MPIKKCSSKGKSGYKWGGSGNRLFDKVKVNKETGCWEFTGALKDNGYGNMYYNGKTVNTHKLAYLLLVGDIPDGMQVMHICDNRKCCNPQHLKLGTSSDNMKDMINKGRGGGQFKTGHIPYNKGKRTQECYLNNRPAVFVECDECGKTFPKRKDKLNTFNFCSRQCGLNHARRIKNASKESEKELLQMG